MIIQDPTLLHQVDVFSGLRPDGYVIINTERAFGDLGLSDLFERHLRSRLLTVPAGEFARRTVGRPMPNAALLGAFAAATGLISLASVDHAITATFPGEVGDRNVEAARLAYDHVLERIEGARRCYVRLKAPARSPRRWPPAVPTWSAPTRSRLRPTSSRGSPSW